MEIETESLLQKEYTPHVRRATLLPKPEDQTLHSTKRYSYVRFVYFALLHVLLLTCVFYITATHLWAPYITRTRSYSRTHIGLEV